MERLFRTGDEEEAIAILVLKACSGFRSLCRCHETCIRYVRCGHNMYLRFISFSLWIQWTTRCSLVDRELCYKSGGRKFETRWSNLILSTYLIFPATLCPEVIQPLTEMNVRDRKCLWGVERGRCVKLTTSPPPVRWSSSRWGITTSPRPVTMLAAFFFLLLLLWIQRNSRW
jgi:hypothetical protein